MPEGPSSLRMPISHQVSGTPYVPFGEFMLYLFGTVLYL
jgi:hypothetical protein